MLSTVSIYDCLSIIQNFSKQPHDILGLHETTGALGKLYSLRAYIPEAKDITIVNEDSGALIPMEKIHEKGFFEAVLPGCKEPFKYKFRISGYMQNEWETPDAYSFLPTISEYDRYLFNMGNHYRIYEKLGGHLCEIDGIKGAAFALWAPNAKSVSVVGDFNNWDPGRNQMRILGESGIWEIFVPLVSEWDMYKFLVRDISGVEVYKSDPYGFAFELRPKNAAILVNENSYIWTDGGYLKKREEKNILEMPLNVYEVHPASWKRNKNGEWLGYRELAQRLVPYVKEMGYTTIELMGIAEHPFDGSWGYQVTGYFAPTSRYGAPDDFKYFVDTCHANEIGVILDWVPGHFPKDEGSLARFDGTALYEHFDKRRGEHPEWGTLIFNYGRNEVKNFLISNAIYWLECFHIDGLRVDAVASMLYLDYGKEGGDWLPNEYGGRENLEAVEFLKHLNSHISGAYKGVMMIAEESTSWPKVTGDVHENGLGFTMKWNMGWMNDILSYMSKDPVFRKYHHNELTFSMMYAYSEKFMLPFSHDEVVHGKSSMIGKMSGDIWQKFANLRLLYSFMYGHPGKKLMFMGNEVGQFSEWSEERAIEFELVKYESHRGLFEFVKDINRLYAESPCLWELDFEPSGFKWIDCNNCEGSFVSFARTGKSGESLIFACNFTPEVIDGYNIGVEAPGEYEEILNSDNVKYGGSGILNGGIVSKNEPAFGYENSIKIKIPPLGAAIFRLIS
ncbi:MAG: 1,4-alpha-glucan branching protein GlgB [Lachnospiraceae bacterium]|nr:1,4-alpha-glucan branching protein GlgB [Lachnospiraceae bacterium]